MAAGAATVVALVSIWHAAAPTWNRLNDDHRTWAPYTEIARNEAAAVNAGFAGSFFDTLASYVEGDDRVYFQAPHRAYGTLDLHDTLAALGRWYLAPAIEVTDPDSVTVVISYEADPAELGKQWVVQRQLGDRIWFSRVSYP